MKRHVVAAIVAVVAVAGSFIIVRSASSAPPKRFSASLSGFQVVPALSTSGRGSIVVTVTPSQTLRYKLTYSDLSSDITQAHIHFGQPGVNGGVSAFLCTNLGNGPAGTPECPAPPSTVTGEIAPAAIVGPTAQGISAGEMSKVITALRKRVTYADIHSTADPSGELRGLLKPAR